MLPLAAADKAETAPHAFFRPQDSLGGPFQDYNVMCAGVEKGPLVTVGEAEAAVSKAKEAAQHSQHEALQECNADWIKRSGGLSCSLFFNGKTCRPIHVTFLETLHL